MKTVYKDENPPILIDQVVTSLENTGIIDYCVVRNNSVNAVIESGVNDPYEIRNNISKSVTEYLNKLLALEIYVDDDRYIARITTDSSEVESYLTTLTGYLELNEDDTDIAYEKLESIDDDFRPPIILASALCLEYVESFEESKLWNIVNEKNVRNCRSELF